MNLSLNPRYRPWLTSLRRQTLVRALSPWQRIDRGDIITLRDPNSVAVKRVIGVPGDTVQLWMG
jgi:hypothetical protein